MKRLKNRLGESIAETLVAVLIMALAFLTMVGAVTASARVNSRIKNVGEGKDTSGPTDKEEQAELVIQLDGALPATPTPELYEINGNYYYE